MIRTYEITFRVANELDVQVQESALMDVVACFQRILGDDLLDYKLLERGVEITADEERMDKLVEESVLETCEVKKKDWRVQ